MPDPKPIRFPCAPIASGGDSEELDLLYYLGVLRKHRLLIGGSILVSVVVAGIVSLLLPRTYEAETTILPISRSSNSRFSSLLSNMGGLADLAGLSGSLPEEGSDLLANFLESRTLARRVIEKEALLPHLVQSPAGEGGDGHDEAMGRAVKTLQENVLSITDNNRGLMSISARHGDPAVASRIANGAVRALEALLEEGKVSAASRTREFLSGRVAEADKDLASAEVAMARFCEENGTISMPDQVRLLFELIASLSSAVAVKHAERDVLEKLGGASSPELARLDAEIGSLEKEILELERGAGAGKGPLVQTNGFIPLYELPEMALFYSRLLRDVEVKRKVSGYLRREHEAAKIRQCREEVAFTVLDPACPPQRPVKPKPLLIVALAGIFSALGAFMIASLLEYLARAGKVVR